MADAKEIKRRETIAKEIARTSASIRKKHRALKTGKVEEEVALRKHFRPIVEPLKQLVEQTTAPEDGYVKSEATDVSSIKRYRDDDGDDDDHFKPKFARKRLDATTMSPIVSASTPLIPRRSVESGIRNLSSEEVFESEPTTAPGASTLSEERTLLLTRLGPLGKVYIGALLRDDRTIDGVYGVHFTDEGAMLGDKRFDVNEDDYIFVDNVTFVGTHGLFELIFKRIPDDALYNDADKQKYKSILLMTNAHRRGHKAELPVMGNKGYKYKQVIAPLIDVTTTTTTMSGGKRVGGGGGEGLPRSKTVNDMTKIDYVHWDDPNELVDRLRLLDASHRAGNDSHDNEILSILEELREAGVVIN